MLTNGDLPSMLVNNVDFAKNGQATNVTFNTASGLFKAKVINPETQKPIQVSGVLLQNQRMGAGYFMGATGTGSALLLPVQ